MSLRYAILHHTDWPGHADHYDVLFQLSPGISDDDRVLRVYSTLVDEMPAAGVAFKKNVDHRRLFLDYEGALTESRGRVQRVAKGICEVKAEHAYAVDGALSGTIYFQEQSDGVFILRRE